MQGEVVALTRDRCAVCRTRSAASTPSAVVVCDRCAWRDRHQQLRAQYVSEHLELAARWAHRGAAGDVDQADALINAAGHLRRAEAEILIAELTTRTGQRRTA